MSRLLVFVMVFTTACTMDRAPVVSVPFCHAPVVVSAVNGEMPFSSDVSEVVRAPVKEASNEPKSAPTEWERKLELMRSLPQMSNAQVEIAVDLVNKELESSGYDQRTSKVIVRQASVEQISFLAGVASYGWTPGKDVYVGVAEDVCGHPSDYNDLRLGCVLTHELLHTVGFQHGSEMRDLSNRTCARWADFCDPQIAVESTPQDASEEPSEPNPGPYVAPGPDCVKITTHCFRPDPNGGFLCADRPEEGVELCGNGIDDDCDGYTDEDLGDGHIANATCYPITE